jgi:glycosyltransferase involved in cell wall biosynthesis
MSGFSSVSVVMPAFNSETYLAESIDSVVKQTYSHWELIVVDDGSADGTKGIVHKYMQEDDRIRYIYQDNSGPASARNHGIQASRYPYIAFLDSDDLWFQDKLEKQMNFAITHPGYVVYGGVRYLWGKDGAFMEDKEAKTFRNFDTVLENAEYFLFHPNLTMTSSVLLKKSMLEKVGLFDPTLSSSEDDHLYYRLALNFKFFALPEPVFYRRRHSENVTANLSSKAISSNRYRAMENIVRNTPQELLPKPKSHILSYWALWFSKVAHEKGRHAASMGWFLKGFLLSPAYYFSRLQRKAGNMLGRNRFHSGNAD